MEWREHYVRVFAGHIHEEAGFVSGVQAELCDYGVDVFVAHNDISPSLQWQAEIEEALGSCQACAVFMHDGFRESAWTDQEVGYAIGRCAKMIPLTFGNNPHGFLARYQGANCAGRSEAKVACFIFGALLADDATRHRVEDGLLRALVSSPDFTSAERRASRVRDNVTNWTEPYRRDWLEEAMNNGQVEGSWKAKPIVEQLLANIEDPKYTLVTTTDTPPTASEVLTNGTESDLEREILITNSGTNGYLWIYAVQDINYIGFQPTGDNQFGGFRAGDDVVLNGTTYHVWRSRLLLGSICDLTWYAYES